MRKIIVCDYDNPNHYTFPNFDMGSSEKRIWHFAKIASELEGYEVIITGPLWLSEYVPKAKYFPKRLSLETWEEFVEEYGKCDFLFAGHEYFDKDEWVKPFEKCAKVLISYQLHPYSYKKKSFNGRDKILFCYSQEMLEEYKDQAPIKALLFHSGIDENPYFVSKPDRYLVWMGRYDRDKAPHYAIEAARQLRMPLYMLGKTVYQPEYFEAHRREFESQYVKNLGFKSGKEKMDIIAKSACAIYTVNKDFSEAGAGVLGEILSCGVPIAGITWKGDDAVCEAVDDPDFGKIVNVTNIREVDIPACIAQSVSECLKLSREIIYKKGSKKYNPYNLVLELLKKADKAVKS